MISEQKVISGEAKMSELGEFVLSLGSAPVLVPIEELGPSLFNREGDWTSSHHCRDLALVINKKEGFATYRYECVWAHEPNPDDPLEVARHGNQMHLVDSALPLLPMVPLKGTFGHTHLVTLLQMGKKGNVTYPDSDERIDSNSGNDAWRSGMSEGVLVKKFKWKDIIKYKSAFLALMASQNSASTNTLSDDELSISHRFKVEALVPRELKPGETMDGLIINAVRGRTNTQLSKEEFMDILSFTNTTATQV